MESQPQPSWIRRREVPNAVECPSNAPLHDDGRSHPATVTTAGSCSWCGALAPIGQAPGLPAKPAPLRVEARGSRVAAGHRRSRRAAPLRREGRADTMQATHTRNCGRQAAVQTVHPMPYLTSGGPPPSRNLNTQGSDWTKNTRYEVNSFSAPLGRKTLTGNSPPAAPDITPTRSLRNSIMPNPSI